MRLRAERTRMLMLGSFPKLATRMIPETQTGGIEFATDYISFETNYIQSFAVQFDLDFL